MPGRGVSLVTGFSVLRTGMVLVKPGLLVTIPTKLSLIFLLSDFCHSKHLHFISYQRDALEEEMATHNTQGILAWEIPWTGAW